MPLLSSDTCLMAYNTTFDERSAEDRQLFNVSERKESYIKSSFHYMIQSTVSISLKQKVTTG